MTVLGSPVFPEAIPETLGPKLDSLKLMASRLEEIDSHDALFLLRNAFAIPKLTYFLHTAPCFENPELLHEFDETLRESLEKILNMKLDPSKWNQCSLPTAFGGLGIRKASDLAPLAFILSALATSENVKDLLPNSLETSQTPFLNESRRLWGEKFNSEVIPYPRGKSQKE